MPSKKQYNLVNDDAYDSRIPIYNEEAFQHGITFHAKYIGSLDVPRPSSRVEIVAAMRRIRYEFKAKSLKKKKISLTVSVDGVKVILRSKRRSNQWPWDESKHIILHHPIYRIFYVSHDSQDLKIFSYIARDGGTNSFKCNVFKSKKKSQAMRIVRTIGQAFEVCHKLSLALASTSATGCASDEVDENASQDHAGKGKCQGDGASEPNSCDTQEEVNTSKVMESIIHQGIPHANQNNLSPKNENDLFKSTAPTCSSQMSDSLSIYHHIQMLKEQLEQQNQQMMSVMGQVQLLKDQLSSETKARLEAQAQNQHLLTHNRELLEHIRKLVNHIHEVEDKCHKTGRFGETSLSDAFLNRPSANIDPYLQNSKPHQGNERSSSTSIGKSTLDEQNISDSFQKNYSRQLSVPSTSRHSSSNSPKLGVSFNDYTSLPGSPSQLNFPSNLDTLFKPNSFVCSSPKVSRKGQSSSETLNNLITQADALVHSPSFSQSSTNHGSFSTKHQIFDFDPVATSSLFNTSNYSPSISDKYSPMSFSKTDQSDTEFTFNSGAISRLEPANHNSSSNGPSQTDSFIAQVTRDLAKMSTLGKSLSDTGSASKPYNDSNFISLYKS